MGDFATVADIDAGILAAGTSQGGYVCFNRSGIAAVAGFFYSGWKMAGAPATGVAPSSAELCTKNTVGALGNFLNARAGGTNRLLKYLCRGASSASQVPILADRLAHMGGLVTDATTLQTVNLDVAAAASAGRCAADASDVDWFIEVFASGGATSSVSATVTFTNKAGTAGRTLIVTLASSGWPLGRLYYLNQLVSASDVSILSIESVQLNTSSGTPGNIGFVAAKRLFQGPFAQADSNGSNLISGSTWGPDLGPLQTGIPYIPNDACLWFFCMSSGTSWNTIGYLLIGGRP